MTKEASAKGSCNCGAITFSVNIPLYGVFVCHCSICRKSTGSGGIPQKGMKVCLFYTKVHNRVIRDGLSQLFDGMAHQESRPMVVAIKKVEAAIEEHVQCAKIAV